MRKGESVEGLAFYNLLYADDDFCKELGRAILAAGRLESTLKLYLLEHVDENALRDAALGRSMTLAKKKSLLKKIFPALEMLKMQRNYLAHNIHALFSGIVEETILERTNLLDSDVDLYIDRARQLAENLNGLSDAISKELSA